jgi:UDP-hydrolysing UDP-N-acetyl-D-glucosamine 2-epimerase
VVTGTHLTTGTWRDLTAAGFVLDAKVSMQKRGCIGRDADVAALGRGVVGLGKTFIAIKPDVILVLGDRIEVMAAATAGSVGGFRVAHMHGGDRAEGVADEAIRHAVSKLAHLHFPATATSAKRLLRMGENPDCIFNVGSPAMDCLAEVQPLPGGPKVIVLQHPIGASDKQEGLWFRQTYRAAAAMKQPMCVLKPNGDPGSGGIVAAQKSVGHVVAHVPRLRFLEMLAGAACIVGNSSAGLIEAAGLKPATVNIGPRQAGREKPGNVVDCAYGQANVGRALTKAMGMDLRRLRHPYGDGQAGAKTADLLAGIDLKQISLRKHNSY